MQLLEKNMKEMMQPWRNWRTDLILWYYRSRYTETYTAQKMKFSIKDFFSKYDQIHRKLRIWSFTEEILNGKLHFFCCDMP